MQAGDQSAEGSASARARGVASVLAGEVRYDDVDEATQLKVRDAWQTGIDHSIQALDLSAEFRALGRSWTEADEHGNAVQRDA